MTVYDGFWPNPEDAKDAKRIKGYITERTPLALGPMVTLLRDFTVKYDDTDAGITRGARAFVLTMPGASLLMAAQEMDHPGITPVSLVSKVPGLPHYHRINFADDTLSFPFHVYTPKGSKP